MIIFIIVCAIIIYVVYQIYSEGEKEREKEREEQEKSEADKKRIADYERKTELERNELRKKYYSSSVTREIADYILAGKSEPPFEVRIDSDGITSFFADDSYVNYSYKVHSLTSICSYSRSYGSGPINPREEFGHALKSMIQERYSSVDYSIDSRGSATYLNRVPTRQF